MVTIVYKHDWPDDARRAVERALPAMLEVIPPWCAELWLYYDRASNTGPAEVDVEYCYANAKVTFRHEFLEADEQQRIDTAVHEGFHIAIAPLVQVNQDMAAEISETNERLGERFKEETRRATERVTSDLEVAWVARKIDRNHQERG